MFNKRVEDYIARFYDEEKDKYNEDFNGFQEKFLQFHKGYKSTSFPPAVFTLEFVEELKNAVEFLLSMVFSIPERVFNNDYKAMLEYQGYKEEDADYLYKLCTPSLLSQAKLLARPDFLPTPEGLKVVEMNVASAIGGIGNTDRHAEVFFRTNLANAMQKEGINISFSPMAKNWADFLYKHSPNIGVKANPVVMMGLLSEEELDINNFNSFVTYEVLHFLRMNGFKVMTAPISKFDFRHDGVYYKDSKIDIVLTSFIFIEARDAGMLDICETLLENHEAGKVIFYGGATSTIFDHKVNLAILSSDEFAEYFTDEEKEKINKYIPRTEKLTTSNANDAIKNKNGLVLKNCISFGGQEVFIGKNCSENEWEGTVKRAARSRDTYIVQRLVDPVFKRLVMEPDGGHYYDMCIGGCYFDGFAGIFIREKQSLENESSIINCSSGAKLSMGFYCD